MFNYDAAAVASILGSSLDAAFTIDERGRIVDANAAAVRVFGWSLEELLGSNISIIVPSPLKEMHDGFLAAFDPGRGVKHVLGSGQRLNGQRKDGSLLPVEVGISSFEQGGKRYFAGFVRDMTARQLAEDKMRHLATHDPDTGLLNYGGFFGGIHTVPDEGSARVIYFQLEEFRQLADTYGRQWRESTLHQLAFRLQEYLSPYEMAARIGEDSFAVLTSDDARTRAHALQQVLKHPIVQGDMQFLVTATMGISLATGSLEERLKAAQWACVANDGCRKGKINEYDEEVGRLEQRRRRMETRLRDAVVKNSFVLHFQPKVRASDRRIIGAEALVRWNDAELGAIPPSEFIPLAERLGLIGGITDWVLRQAMTLLGGCSHSQPMSIAVNFCALDFMQPGLTQRLAQLLEELKADPARLVIELTESIFARDAEFVNIRMQEIKALGVCNFTRRFRYGLFFAFLFAPVPD